MRLSFWLIAIALVFVGVAHAGEPDLQTIEKAVRELRYADARTAIRAVRKAGHLDRDALLRLYALSGLVAAVLEGPDAAEIEFRRLLVLAPGHSPPDRSPVVMTPFERARKWALQVGVLKIEPLGPVDSQLVIRIVSDPLGMVAGARVMVRTAASEPYSPMPGTSLHASLPPGPDVGYYIEVIDASADVLARFGSSESPLSPSAPRTAIAPELPPLPPALVVSEPAPPKPHGHRLLVAGVATLAIGLAGIGGGIGLDASAASEFDRLKASCGPHCTTAQLDGLHARESAAAGLFVVGALAGAVGLVCILVDRGRR